MTDCFFVSDLHGYTKNYQKLFQKIEVEKPKAIFMGGDLLPSGLFAYSSEKNTVKDFIENVLFAGFQNLKTKLEKDYPRVFIILGNDDSKADEISFLTGEKDGLWEYIHNKKVKFDDFVVYGYSYIPPTPFLMKDWEKYDVSRFVDPGCVPLEEGSHSFDIKLDDIIYSTIKKDLDFIAGTDDLSKAIFLFHSPPYKTNLDRAALDGKMFDHAPLDVHIGSIAIQRFILTKQPLISLHGHVHESARITGSWQDKLKNTYSFTAAHDGTELALVRFNPNAPEEATRELL